MKALIKLQNHFVVENIDDNATDEEIIERLKKQITEDGLAEYFNADNLFIARFSDRRPVNAVSGTAEKSIEDFLENIDNEEKEIEKIATERIRELFRKIAGNAKAIDLSEARESYQDNLYGMGVTLYDKHGFYETGILQSLTVEPIIKGTFNGCDSDADEDLDLSELRSRSQSGIVDLLEYILRDIASGDITVEVEDDIVHIKDKED